MSQKVERPVGAFVLSLVAAVLYLIAALILLMLFLAISSLSSPFPPDAASPFYFLTLVAFLCGITLLSLAVGLYVKPHKHKAFGILIIVFSLVGLVSSGGFLIGLLLGIIGGAWAIRWKPAMMPQYPSSVAFPSSTTICANCGYANPTDFEFCGRCGESLKEETRIY